MKNYLSYFKLHNAFALFLMATLVLSCGKDDDDTGGGTEFTASFDVSDGPYLTSKDITFTNKSVGATSYFWTFGDGKTSTEASPKHQYSKDGDYLITLSAFDADGEKKESSKPITIQKNPELLVADFSFPSIIYYQESFSFTNNSQGFTTVSWKFGDGKTSTSVNPSHKYTKDGSYNVELEISDGVNTKKVTKTVIVRVRTRSVKFTLGGITIDQSKTVFGDISIKVFDTSNGSVVYEKANFWDNQGNVTNTGIAATSTSTSNINKSFTLTLDTYKLSQKQYRIETTSNVGCWHQDNIFASWGRHTNYNNTKHTYDTDGNDNFKSPQIKTTTNRTFYFNIHLSVR